MKPGSIPFIYIYGPYGSPDLLRDNVCLVIMGLIFPDRDGAQSVKDLKKIDEKLKIILLSGYQDVFEVVEDHELNVYRVFLKPVDCEVLLSTIRSMYAEQMDPHQFVDSHQKL